MKTIGILYHLARADFLERIRRTSFLLVLATNVFLGYAIIKGDFHLELDGYRGTLNSAWVGGMMSTSAVLLLSLFGFFIIKDTINRDTKTGVGQIIATTPISRQVYIIGKWLSNLTVLLTLIFILALAAVIMQLLGGESPDLDLWQLLSPFLLIAMPAMAIVAALGVFFEIVPFLEGGLGNVIYFFTWITLLVEALELKTIWLDWTGILITWQSMGAALLKVYPAYSGGFNFTDQTQPIARLDVFTWTGFEWTQEMIFSRLIWLVVSLLLILIGSLFFRRFDPTQRKSFFNRKQLQPDQNAAINMTEVTDSSQQLSLFHLEKWNKTSNGSQFGSILLAEIRMMVQGLPWWWYAVAAGLILASLFLNIETVVKGIFPVLWIWPILLWSGMGSRENEKNTWQLIFSTPNVPDKQLAAIWISGFLVTIILSLGIAIRFAIAAQTIHLLAWLAAAIFIPSLALACGVWTGSAKLFEVIYPLIWYLGPINKVETLDYMGIHSDILWPMFLGLGLVFILVAVAGRRYHLFRQ